MTLDDNGSLVECDWCGKELDYRCAPSCRHVRDPQTPWWLCSCGAHGRYEHDNEFCGHYGHWRSLFADPDNGRQYSPRLPEGFPSDLCRECSILLTPSVHRFAEIWHINSAINKLGRAINERRKENR